MATIDSKNFPNKAKKMLILLTDCILSGNNTREYVSNFIGSFTPIKSYLELEKVPLEATTEVVNEKMKNLREKLRKCHSAIETISDNEDDKTLRFHALYVDVLHNLENIIDDTEATFRYVSQMVNTGRKNESVNELNLKYNAGSAVQTERKMMFEKSLALLDSEFGDFYD